MSLDFTSLASSPGFSGDIVIKSDPDYSKAIARWSLTNEREAKLVVYPKDAETVSVTIKWALAQGLPLAVKGGGHSQSGASSVKDGAVIDLERHLGTVKVDPEEKRAFVGGGALWKDVNEEAIKYGLATVRLYLLGLGFKA
jgi:FAD/FMN-containing dehydrogenase